MKFNWKMENQAPVIYRYKSNRKMEKTEDITPKNILDEFVVKYHFEDHTTGKPEYQSRIEID